MKYGRLFSKSPLLWIMIFDCVFFAVCYQFVAWYYARGLPYYDSVGSYSHMFSIMNTTREYGILAGLRQSTLFPLSWLQSFFAAFAGLALPRTPQSLISLNFLSLLVAQFSIYFCLKSAKYSDARAFLLSFLPLLPGALLEWVGGYVDLRRDAATLCMLTGSFFSIWRYLWDPRVRNGIAAGILLGLTLWSRGNVLPYVILISGCVILVWLMTKKAQIPLRRMILIFLLPLVVSILFILPYYKINWESIMLKYTHHIDVFGNRLASLRRYWNVSFVLFFSVNPFMNSISKSLVASFLVATFLSFRQGWLTLRTDRFSNNRPLQLLLSGAIVFLTVMVFNVGIVGMIDINGYISMIPFYPTFVGIFGILCWLGYAVRVKNKKMYAGQRKVCIVGALILLLLVFNIARIYYAMPPTDEEGRKKAISVAHDLRDILGDKNVTHLWLDHLNVYDLNFYITQSGGRLINSVSHFEGGIDTESIADPSRSIPDQQAQFAAGLKKQKYVVITEDLSFYENPSGFFFMYVYGRPVIEELLRDGTMKKIYTYTFNGVPFAVLENTAV